MMLSGIRPMTWSECNEAAIAVRQVVGEKVVSYDTAREALVAGMAAFYRSRFGPAVGSVAVNVSTGQSATRYYDAELKTFRWLVVESPEKAKVEAERVDNLPNEGKGWAITEQDWKGRVAT